MGETILGKWKLSPKSIKVDVNFVEIWEEKKIMLLFSAINIFSTNSQGVLFFS